NGHILFAAAAAEALNLPDSNHDWAHASGSPLELSFPASAYEQLRWTQDSLMPWVWRRMRGLSSADGRVPKRPMLEPLSTPSEPRQGRPAESPDIAARFDRRSGILDP
ncbi:MAG TPA: hypothetical protein VFI55_02575, partial [Mycobacterium sp.]|nr:hypothetical protein [Mycobacterium sp.]